MMHCRCHSALISSSTTSITSISTAVLQLAG